jgi:protein-tyrosine-phosphatase
MAAVLVALMAKKHGVDVEVSSAGATATSGDEANPNAIATEPSLVDHETRHVDDAAGPYDVVVVFSKYAVNAANALARRTGGRVIVRPVADPIGSNQAAYAACRDRLAEIIEALFVDGEIRP